MFHCDLITAKCLCSTTGQTLILEFYSSLYRSLHIYYLIRKLTENECKKLPKYDCNPRHLVRHYFQLGFLFGWHLLSKLDWHGLIVKCCCATLECLVSLVYLLLKPWTSRRIWHNWPQKHENNFCNYTLILCLSALGESLQEIRKGTFYKARKW